MAEMKTGGGGGRGGQDRPPKALEPCIHIYFSFDRFLLKPQISKKLGGKIL